MKKSILIFVIVLLSANFSFAEETKLARFGFEFSKGFLFSGQRSFKKVYNSSSTPTTGVGVILGVVKRETPEGDIRPSWSFTGSIAGCFTEGYTQIGDEQSKMERKETLVQVGLMDQFHLGQNIYANFRGGVSFISGEETVIMDEGKETLDAKVSPGFYAGLGFEKVVGNHLSYFLDANYSHNTSTKEGTYGNWGGTSLSCGFRLFTLTKSKK